MNNIFSIKNFSSIIIYPYSLVVLDIDETILFYENINQEWWLNTISKYNSILNDHNLSSELALKEWREYINNNKPKILDDYIYEFIDEVKNNNCKLILLTARNRILNDITLEHLKHCEFNIDNEDIYFNENKGEELRNIVNEKYRDVKNIICVDDRYSNLDNIMKNFKNTNYNLYLYNLI
jgi:predicted secreted acid phosphatase